MTLNFLLQTIVSTKNATMKGGRAFRRCLQTKNVPVVLLVACSRQGDASMVKRALMNDGNVNLVHNHQYVIHYAARREEQSTALEVVETLSKHGACPNVYGANRKHVLSICRQATNSDEQKERDELVAFVTKSIQSHRRCECCKAENRLKRNDFYKCQTCRMDWVLRRDKIPVLLGFNGNEFAMIGYERWWR